MAVRTQYDEQVKAAVMAALLAGQAVGEIAKQYTVPESTIRSWKSRQQNGESVAVVATEKKEFVGDLLVEYLVEALKTLRIQAEFFRDKTWLKSQGASEVAVLHGVVSDKTIRLLEAIASSEAGTAD